MGLKRQLLDAVKAGYPSFDEDTDNFVIEFVGRGGMFESFNLSEIHRHGDGRFKFEGEFNATENEDLLFEILDASGVEYNWIDAGTTGHITYQENEDDGELVVEAVRMLESYGEIDD